MHAAKSRISRSGTTSPSCLARDVGPRRKRRAHFGDCGNVGACFGFTLTYAVFLPLIYLMTARLVTSGLVRLARARTAGVDRCAARRSTRSGAKMVSTDNVPVDTCATRHADASSGKVDTQLAEPGTFDTGSGGCNRPQSARSRSPRESVGFCVAGIIKSMLVAYIDEIGEPGAFVSKEHPRYNTSPAFGYAGMILPEHRARFFGSVFVERRRQLFAGEIAKAENPGQFEQKGSTLFTRETPSRGRQYERAFRHLAREVVRLGGHLFYYADEKPIGTPRQTRLDHDEVEALAMQETLNRLCRYSDDHGQNLMVMIDQINESQRNKRIPNMYAHILSRTASKPEMKRIIEPPMHVDSVLSANIQFADWVAAFVGRAVDYQLIDDSPFKWVTATFDRDRKIFTNESKLYLRQREVNGIQNSSILQPQRPLYRPVRGQRIGDVAPELHRVHAASQQRK